MPVILNLVFGYKIKDMQHYSVHLEVYDMLIPNQVLPLCFQLSLEIKDVTGSVPVCDQASSGTSSSS